MKSGQYLRSWCKQSHRRNGDHLSSSCLRDTPASLFHYNSLQACFHQSDLALFHLVVASSSSQVSHHGLVPDHSPRPSSVARARSKPGLASHFLASLKVGDTLSCAVRPGQPRFSPPADPISTPTIMICADACLALFRGFVQDRTERLRQDQGLNSKIPPALLYIGCRGLEHALYAADLQGWQDSGAVEVCYAYSRHGAEPDGHLGYVQDRVWADRDELVRVWGDGAMVYVCGNWVVSHGVRDLMQRIYREQAKKRCGSRTDAEVEGW